MTSRTRVVALARAASWCLLTYGILSFARIRADLGEKAICGPWGCLPPLQALIAAHGFWIMVLVPGIVLAIRRLSGARLRAVARLLTTLGGTGILAVIIHTLWVWGPATVQSGSWWHLIPRAAFAVAMFIDAPLAELVAAGAILGLIARRGAAGADRPDELPATRHHPGGTVLSWLKGHVDRRWVSCGVLASVATCGGCHETKMSATTGNSISKSSTDDGHAHRPGAHGGILVPLDGAHYHVEAIATAEGTVRLHLLGEDESRVMDVESQRLTAYARADDSHSSATLTLAPEPQPDDPRGRTSAFVGSLPSALVGRKLSVIVPNIKIAGQRLRFAFQTEAIAHDQVMPEKTVDEAESRLYLTPGGKYTEEDIAANGNRTGSEKFAGFLAKHDPNPKPGDRTCPITETKANPKCTWIVGGKTYEFCCPPCVDEFVRRAKESPDKIADPDSYVSH